VREAKSQIGAFNLRLAEGILRNGYIPRGATELVSEQFTQPAAPHGVPPAIDWRAEFIGPPALVIGQQCRNANARRFADV